jgi:hypothetical protein
MRSEVALDTLVRGPAGNSGREDQMRVTAVSPFGWLVGVNAAGQQRVMYTHTVEGPPRPVKDRRDIPAHLQR